MQLAFETALALRAIRSNGLRSVLTVLIIAVGIMALVGILTAFEILQANVTESFSSLGANSFQIAPMAVKKKRKAGSRQGGQRMAEARPISYDEARAFKERFNGSALVGISFTGSRSAVAQFNGVKSNPNITKTGVENAYFTITDTRLLAGRTFSSAELANGSYVCILGFAVARKLSPQKPMAVLDQSVLINNVSYRVVGIADEQGGSMRMSADNLILVPLENARMLHGTAKSSYLISVAAKDPKARDFLAEEAEGQMRVIRKLRIDEEANFGIQSNESMMKTLLQVLGYLLAAAVVVASITLLGSVIGLMNIMLVSVAERTREIGVSKALGAKASTIRRQFLLESVLIGAMGGVLGALLGVGVGNLLGLSFGSGFVAPWLWMGLGILLCIIAGIISGIYPAIKASRLNPITALRYE